jgi:hypothetical protein
MLQLRLEDVVEVQVRAGNHQQRLTRLPAGTWSTARAPVPAEIVQRLERGPRFLHVSASQLDGSAALLLRFVGEPWEALVP